MDYDRKQSLIFLVICIACIGVIGSLILLFMTFTGEIGYYVSDSRKNEDQVEEYLIKYIKDKYNVDCKLTLEKKELEPICEIVVDGCGHYANNRNIYRYEYSAVDENGKQFFIEYRNGYRKRFFIKIEPVIDVLDKNY